jgi:hypothetical protein
MLRIRVLILVAIFARVVLFDGRSVVALAHAVVPALAALLLASRVRDLGTVSHFRWRLVAGSSQRRKADESGEGAKNDNLSHRLFSAVPYWPDFDQDAEHHAQRTMTSAC